MHYRQMGSVPGKRHTQHRDPEGNLYYEELMGEEGFSSDSSLLYHRGVPSAILDSTVWELPEFGGTPNHPLKPRHLKLHDLEFSGSAGTAGSAESSADAVTGRRLVLGNNGRPNLLRRRLRAVPALSQRDRRRVHPRRVG